MFSICPPAGCWRPMFVVAFDGLAYALAMSSQIFLIEQHLCRSFYAATDPTIIRPDGSVPEHKCKMEALQSKVAFYSGLFDFSIMTAGERLSCFSLARV
ncbi:hypothetical protein RRF57_008517 [Xylaria bambusicola]|uniref:Uncharacterized protein n=1 Tax=Xylaria bambusicola TaxID=326684 RepID=A0AAN7UN72_9PEZI